MTAVLIGSFNLGDAIPGLNDVLDKTGGGLQDLKSVVDTGLGTLTQVAGELDGLANDLDALKDDITGVPFQAAQDLLTTAQSYLEDLEKFSGANYLKSIQTQLTAASTALGLITDAAQYLGDQITAVNAGIATLQTNVNELQQNLDDLTSVADRTNLLTDRIRGLRDTLANASNEAVGVIAGYLEQASQLLNSGVYVVHYSGQLNSLGGEVDAVLPSTGVGGSELVTGPLLIVKTADSATLGAIKSAFGINL